MKSNFYKFYRQLIAAVVIGVFALFSMACPKAQNTYRAAKEASAKIQIYGTKLIDANIAAYKAKEISQADFAALNRLTGTFVEGVEIYRAALKEAEKILASGGTLPKGTLDRLDLVFNEKVVDAFLAMTQKLGVIPGVNTEAIKSIVAGIRLAILTVQEAFASAHAYEQRSALWV